MTRVVIFKGKLGSVFLVLMAVALMFVWPNRQLIAAQSLAELVTNCTPEDWQIFDEIKQFMPEETQY